MKRSVLTIGPRGKQNRNRTIDTVLFVLFILSSSLLFWGIGIYRKTIIEPKYLFAVASIGTALAAITLLFVTRGFLNALWTFFIAATIGGGTTYFLTLYLNRELADKELTSETFEIMKTGNLASSTRSSCGSPYAIIDFYGYEKELVFYCEYEKSIHTFGKVRLTFFKGFFNFPVVQSQTLVP